MGRTQTNKNSLANLKPARKGEVRNPAGRPPKIRTIPDILGKIGSENIESHTLLKRIAIYYPNLAKDLTYKEAVMRLVFAYAIEGAPWAVQFIAERLEGKVPQKINVTDDTEEREIFRRMELEDLLALANADDEIENDDEN